MSRDNRIFNLLDKALSDANVFKPESKYAAGLVEECFNLISKDNQCITLSNHKGILCSTYPPELIVPLRQLSSDDKNLNVDPLSPDTKDHIENLFYKGKLARTRSRFPIPVLLLGNKFVCRSSTLAIMAETYARHYGFEYFAKSDSDVLQKSEELVSQTDSVLSEQESICSSDHQNPSVAVSYSKSSKPGLKLNIVQDHNEDQQQSDWLLSKVRKIDIGILQQLKVNVICDLMVENKKVKYGFYVTSSEKVDREKRYNDFHLVSMPYPGCEFFAEYSQNQYESSGLKFNWNQAFIDASLQIPDAILKMSNINWKQYMDWDIVTLTQNYLVLLLHSLVSPTSSGVLVHCISGWDRTPLYISLLRLSLWADGLIHQSLDAEEIVYLTLAYDWLLFRHQFYDRVYNYEEIMHFCFNFLDHILTDEYSLLPLLKNNASYSLFYESSLIESVQETKSSPSVSSEFASSRASPASNGDADNKNGDLREINDSDFSEASTSIEKAKYSFIQATSRIQSLSLADCESHCSKTDKTSIDSGQISEDSSLIIPFNTNDPSSNTSTFPITTSPNCGNNSTSNISCRFDPTISGSTIYNDMLANASQTLSIKLEKRKQKLKLAQKEMIPAYCAVLQRVRQNSQGGLATIFGGLESLVNLVKRN